MFLETGREIFEASVLEEQHALMIDGIEIFSFIFLAGLPLDIVESPANLAAIEFLINSSAKARQSKWTSYRGFSCRKDDNVPLHISVACLPQERIDPA